MVNINEYLLKYYFILYYFIYSFFGHFLHCAFIPDLGSHGWFIIILWPDVNLLRLPQLLNEWGAIALVCCSKKSMHRNWVLLLLPPEQTLINNHPKNLCAFVSVSLCVCVLVHVHVCGQALRPHEERWGTSDRVSLISIECIHEFAPVLFLFI